MVQRVVPGLVEVDLIAWLPGELAALGWDVEVSDELTSLESVAVFRTGGVMRDMVTDSATIAIENQASTKERSARLARDIRSIMHSLEGRELNGRGVSRIQEFAGPAFFPLDESRTRYTQTLSVDIAADVVG